ncbi:glycerol-3-phosphate dehydrogenase [Aureimonas frigidaquae]|uniref:glycerol-3-phosphate dehydrogenase n=1 Tax=Aureimonas frigidaquae TaxID=424757 RepID=UPI00078118E8|nr:glycerol-3-phosphate dehydrogenase [Aureimonas frigidaquae]
MAAPVSQTPRHATAAQASADYDIFVIGGGINGCGIARDAAGRGFRVALAEMNDLGSGTSSWSTKLIHGGLRYLEHYDFRLVRHALKEREVLLEIAPHIVEPLRFVLPHHAELRPAWLLRAGLFLYDHLGGRQRLPKSCAVDLTGPLGAPLKDHFRKGFEYSDARVDDTRLVILNARDAAARGAEIMARTRVCQARRRADGWSVDLEDRTTGARRSVSARLVVNAAGPWVDGVNAQVIGQNDGNAVRLVQGSHIVTRRLYDHDRAYIFQNADGRIIFAIPYAQDFTLIGTTDRDYAGDPSDVAITQEETDYLLSAASEYFREPLTRADIVWSFSGVRPLFNDGAGKAQESSRDYVLRMDRPATGAPLLNCFGGKITTYRVLAEDAMRQIEDAIGHPNPSAQAPLPAGWTGRNALPGGDFSATERDALIRRIEAAAPGLDRPTVTRLARSYGTDALRILAAGDLGRHFGHGLYEAEVTWLMRNEWALAPADILWRRTKLGLVMTEADTAALAAYMAEAISHGNGGSKVLETGLLAE